VVTSFNLLTEPLIRIIADDGSRRALSLPAVYAALTDDRVAAFATLRPHQRHGWHAFLVQVATQALHKAGVEEPPADTDAWRGALRGLTPGFPDDEPWSLTAPPDKPSLLQAPLPEGSFDPLKNLYAAPDEIDTLVTSRNHDLKTARMTAAEPDDWLYALVQVQTCEGYLGRGNYGISRMNSGYGNRPGISVAPPGGIGRRVIRDIRRLLALRPEILGDNPQYPTEGGLGLVWLEPWDGTRPLSPGDLDPYYVEICRRLRLVPADGDLAARGTGSKAARIAMPKELNGITGDPWTPIDLGDGRKPPKALTVDGRGFHYHRLARILFSSDYRQAPLQAVADSDGDRDLTMVCRALARGEGQTEGLHERIVRVSRKGAGLLRRRHIDPLAGLAEARITDIASLAKALRYALMVLFQGGPDREDFKHQDKGSGARAEPFLARFDAAVDRRFFDDFWTEADHLDAPEAKAAARRSWLLQLRDLARDVLRTAESGSPVSTVRSYRAIARAEGAFDGAFAKAFPDIREHSDAA
jgi:CRISPR system Cascade subunit CasA